MQILRMLLQALRESVVLHHHHSNHRTMLVNKELLVFQVLNQLKVVVVVEVAVVLHHPMIQMHSHHKAVLMRQVIQVTILQLVAI